MNVTQCHSMSPKVSLKGVHLTYCAEIAEMHTEEQENMMICTKKSKCGAYQYVLEGWRIP